MRFNCQDVGKLIHKIEENDLASILLQYSDFFMISFEVTGHLKQLKENEKKVLLKLVSSERPLIVQLKASTLEENWIYYKEETSLEFQELLSISTITTETAMDIWIPCQKPDVSLLLRMLKSNIYGVYENDLLKVKLFREERSFLTEKFGTNALCLRFLKLHHEELSKKNLEGMKMSINEQRDLFAENGQQRTKLDYVEKIADESSTTSLVDQLNSLKKPKMTKRNENTGYNDQKSTEPNLTSTLEYSKTYDKYASENFVICKVNLIEKILSRSRLFSSHEEYQHFRTVRQMFEDLMINEEFRPIFEVAAFDEELNFIFDFTHSEVDHMISTKKHARALYIPSKRMILIGAREHQKSYKVVIGCLAHEITHSVMQKVFDNDCKPYYANYDKRKRIFDEVVVNTERTDNNFKNSLDGIISRVFKDYLEEKRSAELIVRVPQILIQYSEDTEALLFFKAKFSRLCLFYSTETMKDIQKYIQPVKEKCLIREINSAASLLSNLQLDSCNSVDSSIVLTTSGEKFNIIKSKSSNKIFSSIYQSLQDVNSNHIFVSIELLNEDLVTKINTSFKSSVKPNIYIEINCVDKFKLNRTKFSRILPLNYGRNRVTVVVTHEAFDPVVEELKLKNIEVIDGDVCYG